MKELSLHDYATMITLVAISLVICIYIITNRVIKISKNVEALKNKFLTKEEQTIEQYK